jgi:hypothetical protein
MATTIYHLWHIAFWTNTGISPCSTYGNPIITNDKMFQKAVQDMDVIFKLQLIRSLVADHCNSHLRIFPEMADTDSDGFVTVIGPNLVSASATSPLPSSHDIPDRLSQSAFTVVCKISEVYTEIQMILYDTSTKIHNHNNSILRYFSKLDLSKEISDIERLSRILDTRLALFIDVHKLIHT